MPEVTTTAPGSFFGRVGGQTVAYVQGEPGGEYAVVCGRCGGTGYIQWSHVDNGRCFQCGGGETAYGTISVERANHLWAGQQKAAAKKEAKRLAVCAERDARVARLEASAPEVAAVLWAAYNYDGTGRRNSFYEGLASQVFNAEGKDLTENQVAAVQRGLAKQVEEAANAVPVVEGRGQVTGVITSIKVVETQFGAVTKVTVQDDRGFRVYGSLAKNLVDEFWGAWRAEVTEANGGEYEEYTYGPDTWHRVAKGARVTFVATVEASQDDKAFGFFSRPTRATVEGTAE